MRKSSQTARAAGITRLGTTHAAKTSPKNNRSTVTKMKRIRRLDLFISTGSFLLLQVSDDRLEAFQSLLVVPRIGGPVAVAGCLKEAGELADRGWRVAFDRQHALEFSRRHEYLAFDPGFLLQD